MEIRNKALDGNRLGKEKEEKEEREVLFPRKTDVSEDNI
jgi:hypothetical protein